MGVAKTSMLVLIMLGYAIFAGGVVLANLPVEALLSDPPLFELGVSTVVAVVALVLVESFFP